jgi:hypothetical protein
LVHRQDFPPGEDIRPAGRPSGREFPASRDPVPCEALPALQIPASGEIASLSRRDRSRTFAWRESRRNQRRPALGTRRMPDRRPVSHLRRAMSSGFEGSQRHRHAQRRGSVGRVPPRYPAQGRRGRLVARNRAGCPCGVTSGMVSDRRGAILRLVRAWIRGSTDPFGPSVVPTVPCAGHLTRNHRCPAAPAAEGCRSWRSVGRRTRRDPGLAGRRPRRP